MLIDFLYGEKLEMKVQRFHSSLFLLLENNIFWLNLNKLQHKLSILYLCLYVNCQPHEK